MSQPWPVLPPPKLEEILIHIPHCPGCGMEDLTLMPWTLEAVRHDPPGLPGWPCPFSGQPICLALTLPSQES